MGRKKKTRAGAEVKSLSFFKARRVPVWWFAILEGKRFQIFSYRTEKNLLEPICNFQEPDFRGRIEKRLRDSPGRIFNSFSRSKGGHQTASPRHSYSSQISPKKQASLDLLHQACVFLDRESRKDSFQHLALFANPQNLGFLRNHLTTLTTKRVKFEVPHSLSYLNSKNKIKLLSAYLPLASYPPPRVLPTIHGA